MVFSLPFPSHLILISVLISPSQGLGNKKIYPTRPKRDPTEFLVHGLQDVEPAFGAFDGIMYAGLLPIDLPDDDSSDFPRGEFMFWFFQPNNATAMDTLTIWLNGGPGCSSFFAGVLFECAPVTTPHHPAGYEWSHSDEPLVANEWAWTKATNMLFVDQPGGVGFSHGPTPNNEFDVSSDFYNFLVNFFDTFESMQKKRLFIFGESYAGYYVPSIAHKIYRENKYGSYRYIHLSGIGLGNAWMDAMQQGPTVIDYAWWHGLIDSPTRNGLHEIWEQCKAGGDSLSPPFHKFTIPDECGVVEATLQAAGADIFPDMSPNTYDVTTWDKYPILFDDNSTIMRFYNDPKVKKALHAPMNVTFHGCIPGAGRRRRSRRRMSEQDAPLPGKLLLAHDKPESVVSYVAELLDGAGIRVLVYNGDRDLSCNAPGSEMLLDNMMWNGDLGWGKAPRGLWMVNGTPSGYARSHDNLDFLVIRNSGHLVPNNRPMESLDLITRFVTGQTFHDVTLPTFHLPRNKHGHAGQPPPRHDDTNAYIYALLLVVVAVVCFFSGILAASRLGWRNDNGYAPIVNDSVHEECRTMNIDRDQSYGF